MPAGCGLEHFDGSLEAPQGPGAPKAAGNDEIRPTAFLAVTDLVSDDPRQRLGGHPGPGKHSCPLHEGGGGHHDHRIADRIEPDLEQQRDVEHHQPRTAAGSSPQKAALDAPHHRVDDSLQTPQRRGIVEYPRAQRGPVDGAVLDHVGEGRSDQRHRRTAAFQEPVHRLIGVVDRQAHAAQHGRRGGLAHADRAGQADDHHHGRAFTGRGRP